MPGRTAWILGNQLSLENPVLEGADRVLLVESAAYLSGTRFHRQKLHLVYSAMRHFARELEAEGRQVDLRAAPTLREGVADHVADHGPAEIVLLEPTSAAAHPALGDLPRVCIARGTLFLTHPDDFTGWAQGRRRIVMEDFYRWQRKRLGVLMDGDQPAGGRWNLDKENREPPPRDHRPPTPWRAEEDEIDSQVRAMLDAHAPPTFGVDGPRRWPATHAEALEALADFVANRLPTFGPWQDAMLRGERFMWHGLISSSLNLGLLSPLEAVHAVETAYRAGDVPLASAEGFIRQVIGWREYVWGEYWLGQERWANANALDADRPLPELFWGGPTDMACLSDSIAGLEQTAYSHHIERLMLYGNLMLLLGVRPQEALEWFQIAFIDGYEWVMHPNVLGMALFADGGRMMTKPYAASGRYVNRMSNHCKGCRYDPGKRTGENACPYTTLYWHFLDRNRARLQANRRMGTIYSTLDRFGEDDLREIRLLGDRLRERFDA